MEKQRKKRSQLRKTKMPLVPVGYEVGRQGNRKLKGKAELESEEKEGREGAAVSLKPQSNDHFLAPRLTQNNAAIAIFSNYL